MAEFKNLIQTYGPLINKVCWFYATDTEDFQDLRQEALLNLWRSLEKFKGASKVSTWIYRITLNSCVSYFRKNKKMNNAEPIENHTELLTDDDERSQMIRQMYNLINILGNVDKAIILMWLDGNDYGTIGEVIGMNKATIGTRIHRIKEKLVELSNQ